MVPVCVTAVIPAYNAVSYVGEAVESALRQTNAQVDVVVVDDGSTDGTRNEVLRFAPRVRYIHQRNAGVSAARNRGIAEAVTEFVAVLDADDVWLSEKTATQLAVMSKDDGAVAVGCGLRIADERLVVLAEQRASRTTYEDLLLWESTGGLTGGSGLLARTDAVRAIGGYDTRLSTSADWDLALRLLAAERVALVSEPLYLYRQHSGSMHRGIRTMERDMLRILRKARDSGPQAGNELHMKALGRLYAVLAGSYWHADEPAAALRCGLQVLRYTPAAAPALMRRLASKAPVNRRRGPE